MSDELKERLDAAMEAYWNAAYQQGVEGRNHDDMNGTAQFAEDNLRALFAHLSAPIKPPLCPRPCNHRPDVFSQADCLAAGECGCGALHLKVEQMRDIRDQDAAVIRQLVADKQRLQAELDAERAKTQPPQSLSVGELKRFRLEYRHDFGDPAQLKEHPEGEWVRYQDVEGRS